MQCYNPRLGFRRLDNTRIKYTNKAWSTYIYQLNGEYKLKPKYNTLFSTAKNIDLTRPLKLPCSKCEVCVLNRAGDTARRAYDEYRTNNYIGMFITLTYDDDHKPKCGHFDKNDIELFVKRLRKISPKIKTLGVAEYGEKTKRPHFHLLVFGHIFQDKTLLRITDSTHTGQSYDIFQSKTLQKLWDKGITEFGSVTEQSCSYVARYLFKKNKKEMHGEYCEICKNEKPLKSKIVCRSRRPGLGADFCDRYFSVDRIRASSASDTKHELTPRYYLERVRKSSSERDRLFLEAKPDYEKERSGEAKERLDALREINKTKFKNLLKTKI